MIRTFSLFLIAIGLFASTSPAQILFSYEDLDPDATSPVGGGVAITDLFFDVDRVNVGSVDVGAGTGPFMSLITDPTPFDVSGFAGKSVSAFAETYIPSSSTINTGDSIYLQVDYFNDVVGAAGAGNFVRETAGFYNDASTRDTWLPLAINSTVPAMTDNADPINRANVSVVIVDGGFGGVPNDSGSGEFAFLDNFSFTISEPVPPNPLFFSTDAPSPDTMPGGNLAIFAAQDPLDPSNDVGQLEFQADATFVNRNIGPAIDVSAFEGQKFRAAFDYLVPADTALEPGDDTFWAQVGFNDPVSASVNGGGNSTSAGFPAIDAVADGVWRTIEITGEIPPDTDGATFSITASDDGFAGGPADTFGTGFFIDNVIFEALEVIDGDYNNDGVVDAADYTVFRDNIGAEAPSAPYEYRDAVELSGERSINFAGDGADGVTEADRTVWANNYGTIPAPASGAIPEPGAGMLLLAGIALTSWRRDGVARRSEVE